MIPLDVVRDRIIAPSLQAIQSWNIASERLVLGTGLVESRYQHVRQIKGPALSYWQIEPATHDDLFANYLGGSRRKRLLDGLRSLSSRPGDVRELETNPFYAAAMCRIFYLRIKAPLPDSDDAEGMAAYHKRYYNTYLGKTDPKESVVHFQKAISID